MSHTITPKIRKELQAFADRITPPQAKPGSVPGKGLTGAELREQYGLTRDAKGQPLKDAERYLTKDVPAVNQLRRLCKAFTAGGWPKVELYLQPYRTPEAIAREASPAAAEQPVATGAPLEFSATVQLHPEEAEQLQALFDMMPHAQEFGLERGGTLSRAQVAAALELEPAAAPVATAPAPKREFTKLCERWEKEADAAQQLSAGGRGAGRQQLQEAIGAGLHYPAEAGAVPAGPLYVAGYSDEVGAPVAGAWLDESGTVTPEQLPARARGFCPIEAGAPSCSCSTCSCSSAAA